MALGAAPAAEQVDPRVALLDRLGRVSLLYADTVLRFSCDETFRAHPGGGYRDSYIYVFGEDGRFHDYRTRRRNGQEKEVPLDRVPVRRFLTQPLSWVFQFHPARAGRIRFTFKGEGTALGVPAVVVAFEPVPPIEADINEWHGTAWIDPGTAQILRVEALKVEDETERRRFEDARSNRLHEGDRLNRPLEEWDTSWSTVTTEFGVVAHGLRFPSLAVIETRTHMLPRGGNAETISTDYRVEQAYANYRFFSVRSEDEVERLTGASVPPPPP